jgi:hypothetical protein
MKIYVTHSRKDFDFKNELYLPLRNSVLNSNNEIVLPHEFSDAPFNSRDYIPQCDLVIAEVSTGSLGQGIELGWADAAKKPIICVYRKGTSPSGSLKVITNQIIEYENNQQLIEKLSEVIKSLPV